MRNPDAKEGDSGTTFRGEKVEFPEEQYVAGPVKAGQYVYCKIGNVRENLIFANIYWLANSKFSLIKIYYKLYIDCMGSHSLI